VFFHDPPFDIIDEKSSNSILNNKNANRKNNTVFHLTEITPKNENKTIKTQTNNSKPQSP
jgi:hypothetical protein